MEGNSCIQIFTEIIIHFSWI